MISLGVGELLAASSLILVSFFGGERGVSADRTFAPPFFGVDFAQDVQVYFLAAAWLFVSVLGMYLFTRTPAGRLANAVRDNPERAQFLGYSAQRVRFISFVVAGFFAGIAGGLFAVNYEILTAGNLNAASSGQVLLMAYIGGLGVFIGPIIGAVLLTLINSLLNHYTTLWMLYLGLVFVLTVMFLPRGLTGLLMLHRVPWQQGRLGLLIRPYTLTAIPGAVLVLSLIGLLEMSQRETGPFVYLGIPLAPGSAMSWLALLAVAVIAFVALRRTLPGLRAAWAEATAQSPRSLEKGDAP
jgi:branched-chain amino acid transport system permease protein